VLKRALRLSGVAEIDCYVNDNHLARFQGDGFVFVTRSCSDTRQASKQFNQNMNRPMYQSIIKSVQSLAIVHLTLSLIHLDFPPCFVTRSLLVATPTGSTAYSIGGGGSIVHPEIDAILLTPLNSMSLSSRPAILPGSCVIKLKTLQVCVCARAWCFVGGGVCVIVCAECVYIVIF
jgi:hypothetical protein